MSFFFNLPLSESFINFIRSMRARHPFYRSAVIFLMAILTGASVFSQEVSFFYINPSAGSVYLAGEMNNWSPTATPMQRDVAGQWSVTLNLAPGQYLYKFVVDGNYINDPDPNALFSSDGRGGVHSYRLVGEGNFQYHLGIPHGTVVSYNFQSAFLITGIDVNVYLPPAPLTDSLPILILLHGSGMDKQQWTDNGLIANYMDNLLAKGIIRPFIIAMPSYMPFSTSEDLPGFMAWDLPGFLKTNFNASNHPKKSALGGMSLGGWVTLWVGENNPSNFGLLIPISSSVPLGAKEKKDLVNLKRSGKILLYCGTEDALLVNNESLATFLNAQGIPFQYFKSPGGHTWQYWNSITPDFLKRASDFFYSQR